MTNLLFSAETATRVGTNNCSTANPSAYGTSPKTGEEYSVGLPTEGREVLRATNFEHFYSRGSYSKTVAPAVVVSYCH